MPAFLRQFLLAVVFGAVIAQAAAAGEARTAADRTADEAKVLMMLRLPGEHFRADGGFGGGYGVGATQAARRRIAERLARNHGLNLVDQWPMPEVGVDCFVLSVPAGQSPQAAAAAMSAEHDVSWAEPLQLYHGLNAANPPNDPLWRLQPAASAWRLADLHQIAKGRGVTVAVIDSGVDVGHPDLKGQMQSAQDFVRDHPGRPERHGTAVAGVIAAIAGNGLGIAGVAPDARLMALRACWQDSDGAETVCDSFSLAKALHFAIEHNAQVINLSLSGPPDPLLEKLIDAAQSRRAVLVAAIDPNLAHGGFPASHTGVLAVTDQAALASRSGAYLAPGRDVPTTEPGAKWVMVNGSSFAAAHVSGLVALMLERRPRVRDPVRDPVAIVSSRGGEIDAYATLTATRMPPR